MNKDLWIAQSSWTMTFEKWALEVPQSVVLNLFQNLHFRAVSCDRTRP